MLSAAKEEIVFPLAALPLTENLHPGLGASTHSLHRVINLANSNTATRLAASLYDEGRRSRCTPKERDQETGLDYFGARYYGNALGRFTSTDPVSATPLHIVNPQRWNMYAYAIDDPLAFTDPDGRDAIAVNFSKEVPIGGHEGIMSVHKDGTVQYARFGPEGGDRPFAPGAVNWVDADFKVQFGPNGLPTDASYKRLADFAAKVEGQDPSTVRMNYFKTSEADTAALDAWMKRIAEASVNGKAPTYDVMRQNCATFCIAGLIQGNAIQNKGPLSMVPNLLFEFLINRAADTYPHQDQNKETVSKSHKDCLIDRNTGNCVQ